jgi:hypothetical protein
MGFTLEGVDISFYTNQDYPDGEIAVFHEDTVCLTPDALSTSGGPRGWSGPLKSAAAQPQAVRLLRG